MGEAEDEAKVKLFGELLQMRRLEVLLRLFVPVKLLFKLRLLLTKTLLRLFIVRC